MVRKQVRLTDEQALMVETQAAMQHISVAELIRRTIDMSLAMRATPDATELRKRALAAIGCGHSGLGDVSERHDDYLIDTYAQ